MGYVLLLNGGTYVVKCIKADQFVGDCESGTLVAMTSCLDREVPES